MAHNVTTNKITQHLDDIHVQEQITDEQLLDIINELRQLESRPILTELPTPLTQSSPTQKNLLLERCSKEINIHHKLKQQYTTKNIPYPLSSY